MLTGRPELARHVIAFDGDDTLWANDAAQRHWERKCRRRNVEGLPHPGMSEVFRRYLREFGCASDGVARALEASCREISAGELPWHWLAQVAAIPEMADGLNLRCAKGVERVLDGLKHAGYALWLITKGDLIRQAIKLSCFPFLNRFEVVEIVDRKNASVYRRVLAANSCPPDMFTMVGDGFPDDIMPVLRVGGRAVHVVGNRSAVLTSLERALPISRLGVCRHLQEVPDVLGSRAAAFESPCMHNAG
jgi:putative hydrolase of the HAD superfamily